MTQWKSTRLPSHSNIALTSLARSPFSCLRSRSWWASRACLTLCLHTATLTNYSKHWCWPPKETRHCVCSARFSSARRSLIIHYVISFADTQWALRPALAAAFSLVTAPASLFTFILFFFQCSVRWCFVLFQCLVMFSCARALSMSCSDWLSSKLKSGYQRCTCAPGTHLLAPLSLRGAKNWVLGSQLLSVPVQGVSGWLMFCSDWWLMEIKTEFCLCDKMNTNKTWLEIPTYLFPAYFGLTFTSSF